MSGVDPSGLRAETPNKTPGLRFLAGRVLMKGTVNYFTSWKTRWPLTPERLATKLFPWDETVPV